MQDVPLFRMPTGYQFTLKLAPAYGWTVIVDQFYEGEHWTKDDRDVYAGLSLGESVDVMLGIILGG